MTDDQPIFPHGTIAWVDLTVPNATGIGDFYREVTGWSPDPVDMGGYSDFNMIPTGGEEPVAGICHAQGENAGLPAMWLIYISVPNLDRSLQSAIERGARPISGIRESGDGGRYIVLADPAGAAFAIFQAGAASP